MKLKEHFGRIPPWLNGSLYRNGPGKYEFGKDTFEHIFDPSAIVQQFVIREGEVFYNSRYVESSHYKQNLAKNAIVNPEIGTWGEDPEEIYFDDQGPGFERRPELGCLF